MDFLLFQILLFQVQFSSISDLDFPLFHVVFLYFRYGFPFFSDFTPQCFFLLCACGFLIVLCSNASRFYNIAARQVVYTLPPKSINQVNLSVRGPGGSCWAKGQRNKIFNTDYIILSVCQLSADHFNQYLCMQYHRIQD